MLIWIVKINYGCRKINYKLTFSFSYIHVGKMAKQSNFLAQPNENRIYRNFLWKTLTLNNFHPNYRPNNITDTKLNVKWINCETQGK